MARTVTGSMIASSFRVSFSFAIGQPLSLRQGLLSLCKMVRSTSPVDFLELEIVEAKNNGSGGMHKRRSRAVKMDHMAPRRHVDDSIELRSRLIDGQTLGDQGAVDRERRGTGKASFGHKSERERLLVVRRVEDPQFALPGAPAPAVGCRTFLLVESRPPLDDRSVVSEVVVLLPLLRAVILLQAGAEIRHAKEA